MHHRLCNSPPQLQIKAPLPEDTARIGFLLARVLRPGDVVCLHGSMGAGKSHLARAVIRGCLEDPEAEVPSPTYTLVNVFSQRTAGAPEIWHADLYRISDSDELAEIGLEDAVDRAILLVEWPERWPARPDRRLDIEISVEPDETRTLIIRPRGHGWEPVVSVVEKVG